MIRIWTILLATNILEYATYVVNSVALDRFIKLGSMVGLVCVMGLKKIAPSYRFYLSCYLLLFLSALFASLLQLDFTGFGQTLKILISAMILPLLISKFSERTPRILLTWSIPVATILAFQASLLTLLVYLKIAPNPVHWNLERLDDMQELSYGILGFANAINFTEDGDLVRAQSWFIEPSIFAAFVMPPMLLSFGYFKKEKNPVYLICTLICAIGFFLSFSLANFFGLFGVLCILTLTRIVPSHWFTKVWVRLLTPTLGLGIFYIGSKFYMEWAQSLFLANYGSPMGLEKALARNPSSEQLLREASNGGLIVSMIQSNPFGVGLGSTLGANDQTSPNAFLFWMMAGGIPAVLVIGVLYYKLFYECCLPLLVQKDPVKRYLAASFVGITIQGLSYGTWINPAYLWIVAMMIIFAMNEKSNSSVRLADA